MPSSDRRVYPDPLRFHQSSYLSNEQSRHSTFGSQLLSHTAPPEMSSMQPQSSSAQIAQPTYGSQVNVQHPGYANLPLLTSIRPPSRGERYRPVDPFSRSRGSQPSKVPSVEYTRHVTQNINFVTQTEPRQSGAKVETSIPTLEGNISGRPPTRYPSSNFHHRSQSSPQPAVAFQSSQPEPVSGSRDVVGAPRNLRLAPIHPHVVTPVGSPFVDSPRSIPISLTPPANSASQHGDHITESMSHPTIGQQPLDHHNSHSVDSNRTDLNTHPFNHYRTGSSGHPSLMTTPQIFIDHPTPLLSLGPNQTELPHPTSTAATEHQPPLWKEVYSFAINTLPQQLYLNILLQLPALYYSRVSKVFTDAELCLPDIERMCRLSDNEVLDEELQHKYKPSQNPGDVDVMRLIRFKASWEDFIDNMVSEWQMQNVVSVLLLSAVLTLLQIDDVSKDPLSRSTAVFSLVFALMALLHGCVFMARFGSMKKLHKAAMWAEEAQRTTTHTLWNVWVFLSMPAVWLSWSVLAFMLTVLSYIWRTGADEHYEPPNKFCMLWIRIALSGAFVIGLVYFGFSLKTLARYGSDFERLWNEKLVGWRRTPSRRSKVTLSHRSRISQQLFPSHSTISTHPQSYSSAYIPPGIDTPPSSVSGLRHLVQPHQESESHSMVKETAIHVRGPYETLIMIEPQSYNAFDDPKITSLLFSPGLIDNSQDVSNVIYEFSLSRPELEVDVVDMSLSAEIHVSTFRWNQFRLVLQEAWEGKLDIPNVPPSELLSLRKLIISDILTIWNSRYFASRGLIATIDEADDSRVAFYGTRTAPPRAPSEDGLNTALISGTLSVVHENLEESRDKKDDETSLHGPGSLSSPRSLLPYLPQLHREDDDVTNNESHNAASLYVSSPSIPASIEVEKT